MNIPLRLRDGGGDLMTRPSSDEVGPANYVVKRDWRTELDQEVRREGDRNFVPTNGGSLSPCPCSGRNLVALLLTNSAWVKTNSSVTAGAGISPDAVSSRIETMTGTGGSAEHYVTHAVTIAAGATVQFTINVKPTSSSSKGRIIIGKSSSGAFITTAAQVAYDCDLNTATASTFASGPAPLSAAASIADTGDPANDWSLISFTVQLDSTTTAILIRVQEADASGNYTFTGAGSAAQAYAWAELTYVVGGEPATLIHTARQDNGKTALIIGTATDLYRYIRFENQTTIAAGIALACVGEIHEVIGDYNNTISNGVWMRIGSGFTTTDAHRWEAKNVAGYTIFNNGPNTVRYHLADYAVRDMHELREQGICYVGAIEEVAGILVCMDIGVIHEDYLETVMESVGYGAFTDITHYDRVHYRVIWGDPKSPLRWGPSVPGAMTAGFATLTVDYEISSIQPGDSIRVVGAGADGGDLLTTLGYKSATGTWILNDIAETTVTDAAVSLQDAATLIVGSFDCLDDATPILRGIKLQDRLIIVKASGFILGEYTGDRAIPFIFTRIYSGNEAPFWRWTIIESGNKLIYAGAEDFYVFDLITRRPEQHPKLTLCRDLFFGPVAANAATQDQVFVADNGLTKELWFVFPATNYDDKTLAYDYRRRELGGDRCQTIGAVYGAAAIIELPAAAVAHGAAEQWFLLGAASGAALQYGMDKTGPVIWTRAGASYNSDIWPGPADFGDELNEKHLAQYLLLLASQSPSASISIGFFAVRNPGETLAEIGGSPITFATPQTQNTAYFHQLFHLIQERIRVTGSVNVRISKRSWGIGQMGGASFQRR